MKANQFIKSGLILILFFGIIGLPQVKSQDIQGDTWDEVQQNGSGEVTLMYYEETGFAYENSEGELTGVEIDIFQQFVYWLKNARDITLDVNFVGTRDFSKLYNTVKNGDAGVFGMGNVTITPQREQEIDFSPPYLTNIAVLITHESVPDLSSMDAMPQDFSGMTGVVFEGTTHEERMRRIKRQYYPDLNLNFTNSDSEVVEQVVNNTDSFGYVDLSIYWVASNEDKPIKRHPVGDQASESFGIIMPSGSDWVKPMTDFFNIGNGYRSNQAYRRILVKHLGVEVTHMLEIARKQNR